MRRSTASDCFTPLALAAAWTEKLFLGTGDRERLHARAADARDLGERDGGGGAGTVRAGLGAGSSVIVEQWGGVPFESPYRKVRDVNRLVQAMLTGEKVVAELETAKSNGFRLVAASSRRHRRSTSRRCASACCGWRAQSRTARSSTGCRASDVPQCVAAAQEGRGEAGKDPDKLEIVCRIFVCMTEDANLDRLPRAGG